ncbi:hypothetical protein [Methylobacterium sp. 1030]|uniref:hypothetical protein n=1 Tax=Methylobacterium sp. 1030 TaxID=3156404 RepID=UPI003394B0DB
MQFGGSDELGVPAAFGAFGEFLDFRTEQMTAKQDDQRLELLVAQILIALHHIGNGPVLPRGREAALR